MAARTGLAKTVCARLRHGIEEPPISDFVNQALAALQGINRVVNSDALNESHAVPDAAALLDADWTLLNGAGQALTPIRKLVLREANTMQGYFGLVGAFDRLLARLADSVAATLQHFGLDEERLD